MKNYNPRYFSDIHKFYEKHNKILSKINGKFISNYWVMWILESDKFHPDGPIILEIDENQYEFNSKYEDQFAMTVNQINLNEHFDWYVPVKWKKNGIEAINKNLNKKITNIRITSEHWTGTFFKPVEKNILFETINGIEFELEKDDNVDVKNFISIYNNLDENGFSSESKKIGYDYLEIINTGYNNV